ncbi:hypothetical protein SAMN02745174_02057 [Cetobacterium ceti]|uniref:Phage DNA packaging protein, Nu1 subunit of terminase n=1 Tax=Cetobacterium ceti TaxID=180163 RepID=A0A1T4PVA8_9FUSO|nr:hypothetical protein [Cetobacterium ceti]SJZ95379.1 hypothetical protein SAMN02745174_02057 [Cetobacterium ceti]
MGKRYLITKEILLEMFGISERQLANLSKKSIVEKVGERYNLVQSVKQYIDFKGISRNDTTQSIVNAKTLGLLLGISERTVTDLALKGIIIKNDKDAYEKDTSITNYIDYLRETLDKNSEGRQQELNKKKYDAELKELKLKEQKKELHRTEDVKTVIQNMILNFRGKSLVLPSKLAPTLAHEANTEKVEEIIRKSVYELLEELSEWDPND